jgi:cell division protein FtsI (penicillin-binding protein 3)
LSYNQSGGYGGTVQDMLHWSSNVAATKFAQKIPVPIFYEYLKKFGFSQPTGVDLAGETSGSFIDWNSTNPVWVPAYRDTIGYGQGIDMTPLELINAYAALANGGKLMVPHVVQSYTLDGKTVTIQPRVRRQVIQPEITDEVSNLLVKASIDGEACAALVPGYDVAAKTGTTTLYNSNATIASTIAYGPVNMPPSQQFVVLVVLHKPSNQYGSETAAPLVHQILQLLFTYYHRQPNQPYSSSSPYWSNGDPLLQPSTGCSSPLPAN